MSGSTFRIVTAPPCLEPGQRAGASSPTKDDNTVYDIAPNAAGHLVSGGGWGHPLCDQAVLKISNDLPTTHPIGPKP